MSTEANEPVESPDVNLDDFSKEFFTPENEEPEGKKDADEGRDVKEENKDTHDDDGASDTPATDDDDNDDSDEDQDSGDDAPDGQDTPDDPKTQKKNRAQERIEELNSKYREEERGRAADKAAFEARIAALEAKLGQNADTTDTNSSNTEEGTGPSPTDTDKDGNPKYPLGEFDPKFMKDVIQHALEEDRKLRAEEAQKTEQQKQREAAAKQVQDSWNEKLDPAKERYPDFEEKGQALIDSFSDIDQDYGEYLTSVLMSMDKGPDVLYYLSSNPEEARSIVESGAQKATLAFGRIEAMFTDDGTGNTQVKQKATKAPPPPPKNKGSSATKTSLDASSDNVNLDALAKELAKGGY